VDIQKTELLEEITRREKEAGIYPDADVDAFMKVSWLLEFATLRMLVRCSRIIIRFN